MLSQGVIIATIPALTGGVRRPQESEGGVLLTSGSSQTMQDAAVGKVLAKGEDVDISVNVGDTVLFSKYSTSDVKVPDGEVIFAAQKSVLAVLS